MRSRQSHLRNPIIMTVAGAALIVISITALLFIWFLVGSSSSSLWTETAGQALTWVNVENDLGGNDSSTGVWVWLIVAFLGVSAGAGFMLTFAGFIWFLVNVVRTPKVQTTARKSAGKTVQMTRESVTAGKQFTNRAKTAFEERRRNR